MERELRLYGKDSAYAIVVGTPTAEGNLSHLRSLYGIWAGNSPVNSGRIWGTVGIANATYPFSVSYPGDNVSPEYVNHVLHRKARELLFSVSVGENIPARDMVAEDRRTKRAMARGRSVGGRLSETRPNGS